jgi:DNA invertase Pin-like site-specific DNA recombinase
MLFGYARVSKDDQDTATQVAALKAAGCEKIYREKASGGLFLQKIETGARRLIDDNQ